MRVPVTLPSWIVEDGALPVPSVGDVVSYRVTMSAAHASDPLALCIQERVTAQTRSSDESGYFDILLSFPTFTAAMSSKEAIDGHVTLRGRLVVDYELAMKSEGRLIGAVVDRKLLIEETLIPGGSNVQQGYPNRELQEIGARGVQFVRPQPVPGSVWRRPTGLVLTVDTPDY